MRKLDLKVAPEYAQMRLDQFLAELLPGLLSRAVSKAQVRKLIVAGAVYLNRKRVRIASKELIPGARVEVWWDERKIEGQAMRGSLKTFDLTPEHILYRDEWLMIISKPAGIPTQPTLDEARVNAFAEVKRFLSRESKDAYVGLHHRLDRDTSGLLMFTLKKEVNAAVADLFRDKKIQKTYLAICAVGRARVPGEKFCVRNYLGPSQTRKGKSMRYQSVRSGGDVAETDFEVHELLRDALLVQAQPHTGRTHQIRVHLSELGHPILGDRLYGEEVSTRASRLMLHAERLTFLHPISKTQLSVYAPLPEDFKQCLESLRK
jgi:23S rRNA pseudouridine1911/1915/1917 synthase